MITSYLLGGLGNQMFQIATTYALAKEVGVDYKFDFNICWTPAQGNGSNSYKFDIFKNINNGPLNQKDFKNYKEPKFSYSKLPKVDNLILRGYFQSEKYFKQYKDEIIGLFSFSDELILEVENHLDEISWNNSITAVHVRRGDYLKSPNFHPVCSVEYYKKAMEEIGIGNFIFVSDDIEWCKENFKGDNIFYSPFKSEVEDLCLISQCEHQIIANSSFSWWGAYLCEFSSNKVIAPKIWFGPQGPQDTQDIYPENWIII